MTHTRIYFRIMNYLHRVGHTKESWSRVLTFKLLISKFDIFRSVLSLRLYMDNEKEF